MKEKILKNRKLIDILVIILVSFVLCTPLLKSNINVYKDDGMQHIARAYGTMQSIKEGGLLKNVISSFANNFGYSWNFFYGPLSTIGVIICKIIVSSYINGYKLFVFICLVLSGLMMHKFVKKLVSNNNVALLASILYMSFPYHMTDLYLRNALAEYVSFIFIPLVFLGLYNLFYTEDNSYHLAIGAIGLILTHNISTLFVSIFSLFYVIFNLRKLKESKIKKGLAINILFILLITSFFWLPMLEAKFLANYQVYEDSAMANAEDTANDGLNLKQLFVSVNDGSYIFELGPHIIIMLAFSIMTFRRLKGQDQLKENYLMFLVSGIISLWMATKYFPWKFLPDELCIIQFPWRMMMFVSFFFSIVCAINIYIVIKKFNWKDVVVIGAVATGYTLLIFLSFIQTDDSITDIENYTLGKFTGKQSEYVAGVAGGEYLPSAAYGDTFNIATRSDNIEVLTGKALIENEEKNGSNLTANLKTYDSEYTVFELPYIYYPGYTVTLDGMVTQTFETENGFLGIVMGAEDNAELSVSYTGTKIMQITSIISLLSFIAFLVYIWKKH